MSARWTITELAEQVAASLAADAGGQASARVRELPDARTIRWYQTTGLVDRPAALRGRTALYGRRHLVQLVAIKRLQAAGRSLAAIQAELAGMSTAELERIAGVPTEPEAASNSEAGGTSKSEAATTDGAGRPRFWAAAPAAAATSEARPRPEAESGAVHGVRLDDGVLLVLDGSTRVPDDTDLEAIRTAARPLLAALKRNGVVPLSNLEEPR